MKIYTEEQVRRVIRKSSLLTLATNIYLADGDNSIEDRLVGELTPIELPSDKEIENEFAPANESIDEVTYMFIEGAKWMKEQINK